MSETIYLDTETAYWVLQADDAFSVEVVTPWDDPTTVSPFATAADAKVWIAEHRRRLQSLCSAFGLPPLPLFSGSVKNSAQIQLRNLNQISGRIALSAIKASA